ncbi:MAG TPA: hypothetical protein VMZ25_00330, partial [Terriglobales bacterium]|nr:hypothetical protein [Terriglobales bacterium]
MAARIHIICRIVGSVHVFVERHRCLRIAFVRIYPPEPALGDVQIPGAVVVEAKLRIELLTCVQVEVWGRARPLQDVAEGVVGVGVG